MEYLVQVETENSFQPYCLLANWLETRPLAQVTDCTGKLASGQIQAKMILKFLSLEALNLFSSQLLTLLLHLRLCEFQLLGHLTFHPICSVP